MTADLEQQQGIRAELGGHLELVLGKLAAALDRMDRSDGQTRDSLRRMLWPVPITGPAMVLTAGAGTINVPDLLGPHDGYYWDVRRVTVASFTAGTVTAYLNYVADANQLFTYTQPGTLVFGSGSLILSDTDALVFTGSGITGNVTISGQAINVPSSLLSDYLL